MTCHVCCLSCMLAALSAMALSTRVSADMIDVQLRYQQEPSRDSDRFHRVIRTESWDPRQTAIIVCDVWDLHHCRNAVLRLEEFLPRLNDVLNNARDRGMIIIHSPSDCMPFYEDHPARRRAAAAPRAEFVPPECDSWCSVVPTEEGAMYPIDQSDGGEDDDPDEHARWAEQLKQMDRNPEAPWKRQVDAINIDAERDYISDRGTEVWNVLQACGIHNVILTGVHTNMCVLGRPFGLRQMARNGMNVVLMRDLTDTMYNPRRWPYVSHFTGTDLIVSYIERYVCPTITSDQLIGGAPFRFRNDTRLHLVILIAEDEYKTEKTLPKFALNHLGREFRVTILFGSDRERSQICGLRVVQDADVLLVSVRRRVLPEANMYLIRELVRSGKPVIGVRTASHTFALRQQRLPEGFSDWLEFGAEVFGGNYHGHHGNDLKSDVWLSAPDNPLAMGLSRERIRQGGSLYRTSPLAEGTSVIATGSVEGHAPEPVTWTFTRADGGRSFYTSMGHVKDFDNPSFTCLLYRGICWAASVEPSPPPVEDHWSQTEIPGPIDAPLGCGDIWLRCAFCLPREWTESGVTLGASSTAGMVDAWVNGKRVSRRRELLAAPEGWIPTDVLNSDAANLLVVRLRESESFIIPPGIFTQQTGQSLELVGRWQVKFGGSEALAGIRLPAKFAVPADIVFTAPEPLWTARPLTRPGEFTPGIEGPACDPYGDVYAVNCQRQGTIGRVCPDGSCEVFVELPKGSIGNGIRFDRNGNFFVADYAGHNILRVNTKTREVTVFVHDDCMNQPNDLALAPDGTLYASDPDWEASTGQLWRIDADGVTTLLMDDIRTTNGIEVSPDGRTLFVNESVQRNVWAFDITSDRTLTGKRLIHQFDDHSLDGMRCDVDGNLYITRHGAGEVVQMSPAGDILRTIDVLGSRPSNLCFGGHDGCTVYVTEVDATRLVRFRVDRPGRAWFERHGGQRNGGLDP